MHTLLAKPQPVVILAKIELLFYLKHKSVWSKFQLLTYACKMCAIACHYDTMWSKIVHVNIAYHIMLKTSNIPKFTCKLSTHSYALLVLIIENIPWNVKHTRCTYVYVQSVSKIIFSNCFCFLFFLLSNPQCE